MPERKATTLYLEHFGLREAPFKITPTTEFFYGGGQRGEILHALLYAIDVGEGIMCVTGEVGSGKTMLLRTLLDKLEDNVDIIYIANPSLAGREILYNICEELGLQAEESRPDTVRMLQNYLMERYAQGRRVIAFIDEAQAMPDESLEEIRLLSNLETSRDKLLQIVLFGQPEFDEKLAQQNMRQLRERITVKLKLKPFGRDDIREYISTRLRAAGYNGAQLFSNDACRLVAVVSQGLSRRINVLSDKALLSAFERNALTVNYADAKRAVRDVNFGKMRYRSEQSRRISKQLTIAAAAAAACLVVVALSVRLLGGDEVVTTSAQAGEAAEVAQVAEIAAVEEADAPVEYAAASEVIAEVESEEAVEVAEAAVEKVIADATPVVEDSIPAAEPEAPAPQDSAQQVEPVVVVKTVVQIVREPAPTAPKENDGQAMLAAISQLQKGNGAFSGEELAMQIAENSEAHADEPQSQGGDTTWQAVAGVTPEIVNNEQWNWMPASSYLRGRLNATQTWLQQSNSGGYTARLMTVSQDRAVFLETFLRYFYDFYPIRNTMVYPLHLESGKKFVVTFGVYPTRDEAEVFLSNVPYYFTGGKPFAQKLSVSQAEARHAWGSAQ